MEFQREAKELQRQLAMVDLLNRPSRSGDDYEFLVIKLGDLKIKMYLEKGHNKPHVHIDYGSKNHAASYSIEPTERLAGNLNAKYEKTIVGWIAAHQSELLELWEATQRGEDNSSLVAKLAGDA